MRRVEIKPAEQIWLPLYEGDCVTATDRTEHPVGEINFTSRIALVREPNAMWGGRRGAVRLRPIPIRRNTHCVSTVSSLRDHNRI